MQADYYLFIHNHTYPPTARRLLPQRHHNPPHASSHMRRTMILFCDPHSMDRPPACTLIGDVCANRVALVGARKFSLWECPRRVAPRRFPVFLITITYYGSPHGTRCRFYNPVV